MTIADKINDMIDRAVKSVVIISPRFTDYRVDEILVKETPDFEAEIKKMLADELPTETKFKTSGEDISKSIQEKKELKSFRKKFEEFDKGQVGEIQRMTSDQFGNIRGLANNPVQFMMQTVFRKLAKGAGIAGLALMLFEVVKFIINELLKPGRLLDRRFKRDIEREIFAFRSREEKQKLRQGFNNIIITTIGGLRGGSGQIVSSRGLVATGGIDRVINNTFSQPGTADISTGQDLKTRTGKPSRVFGK